MPARQAHQLEPVPKREGLTQCELCGGAEGTLPSHCPGNRMSPSMGDLVYQGKLDFKDGKWIDI